MGGGKSSEPIAGGAPANVADGPRNVSSVKTSVRRVFGLAYQ